MAQNEETGGFDLWGLEEAEMLAAEQRGELRNFVVGQREGFERLNDLMDKISEDLEKINEWCRSNNIRFF